MGGGAPHQALTLPPHLVVKLTLVALLIVLLSHGVFAFRQQLRYDGGTPVDCWKKPWCDMGRTHILLPPGNERAVATAVMILAMLMSVAWLVHFLRQQWRSPMLCRHMQ